MPPDTAVDVDPQPRTDLHHRRLALGLTQQRLGELVGVSAETVASWERGTRNPQLGRRPEIAKALGLSLPEANRMIDLDTPPPVLDGHEVPTWLSHYESLIYAAGKAEIYEVTTIVGLFQTARYAAAVERAGPFALSDEQVEERVSLRLARQDAILREDDPLEVVYLVPEGRLRSRVGGPQVMAEQLRHLVNLAKRPNITLRLLPDDGQDASARGAFQLLTKRGDSKPFMVCSFDAAGARYHENDEIRPYRRAFTYLHDVSLDPENTIQRIQEITTNLEKTEENRE
jgi:transcriptional regulator with XRE-family HTH domain